MALPEKFISQLHDLGLDDLAEALMSTPAVTSVRFNPAKGPAEWPGGEAVPWAKCAFYLPERPRFTLDPRLHQGRYYVQEASSMFHSWVISRLVEGVTSPLRVLDSCAAPGGKTLAMSDALPEVVELGYELFGESHQKERCSNFSNPSRQSGAIGAG